LDLIKVKSFAFGMDMSRIGEYGLCETGRAEINIKGLPGINTRKMQQ
jgi:hypothetical protein